MKLSKLLLSPEKVERHLPKNVTASEKRYFLHELNKFINATYQVKFFNIAIDGYGLIWKKGCFLPLKESHLPTKSFVSRLKRIVKDCGVGFLTKLRNEIKEELYMVTDDHSNGYFHWISDVLPRLELVKTGTIVIPEVIYFNYVLASLEAYPDIKFELIKKREKVKVSVLKQITPVAPTGNYRPEIMQAIRKRFLAYFASDVKPANRKIWVSRQRAPKRTIVNEAELVPILQSHGWEILFMEDLAFADQVRMMAESCAIGGLHGAGLTNMLFMPAGGQVLEVRFRGDAHNNCYFSLASAMEHEYWYLLADPEKNADPHANNVRLEPAALDRVLAEMEEGSPGK